MSGFTSVTRVTKDYAYVDLIGTRGDRRKYAASSVHADANMAILQCEGQVQLVRKRSPKLDLLRSPGHLSCDDLTMAVGDYEAVCVTEICRIMHFMHRIPTRPVQAALLTLQPHQDFIIPANRTAVVCKGRIQVLGVAFELYSATTTTSRAAPAKALTDSYCLLLGA